MSAKRRQVDNQNVTNSAIPLPSPIDPGKWICVTMMIPDNLGHRAAFLGAISNLATWRVWQRDTDHNGSIAAQLWKIARQSIKFVLCKNSGINPLGGDNEDNPMAGLYEPYCRDDGSCGFHFRCDICGQWHDVATSDQVNSPNSPSGGAPQPQPGGGVINVCKNLMANGTLLLDAPVSAGDIVTIVSASGSGNDGGEIQWRCPDGGTYVGGLCDDPAVSFPGGDPVNTAPHMSLILVVQGVSYPFYPAPFPYNLVPITLPGGVTGAYAEIQVNDSDLTNNKGDYSVCYQEQNNSTATWTHIFDFTLNPYGWYPRSAACGLCAVWATGVGWTGVDCAPAQHYLIFQKDFPARVITKVESFYSIAAHAATGGEQITYNPADTIYGALDGSIGIHDIPISSTVAGVTRLSFVLADGGTGFAVNWICTKIIVTGEGVDPF